MPQYQSFPNAKGHSDSFAKLEAIRLPERLTGLSLLDIGCNEGFFCQEAWRRGAARVVGIDRSEDFIAAARRRDPKTDYRVMDWAQLAEVEETFDVVLLLSALHYADDPDEMLQVAFDRVSYEGMLVVECGIAPGRAPEWVRVSRSRGDTVVHATRSMMMNGRPGAVVRILGPSVSQPGDPMPRAVFRMTRRRPMVLLLEGDSGTGKSTLAAALRANGHPTVGLDHMLASVEQWCTDEVLLKLGEGIDSRSLRQFGERIAASGVEERLVDEVLGQRPEIFRNPMTVIEGHAIGCGNVAATFATRLTEAGLYVWHMRPSDLRPRLFGGTRQARRDGP